MELCEYKQVNTKEETSQCEDVNVSWTPFLRQLLVCSGLWTTYFVTGLSLGAPTVVIPQFRREANSTAAVSDELASWLSTALSCSAMPSSIVLPIVARSIGRRPPFIFASITSIASFIVFYIGTTTTHFLISQILQGILFGSNLTVSIIMITEYTSPQYRGIFLTVKSASVFWGMWASNALGTFYRWNYIGLFGLICSGYYVTVALWPESPHWLAHKGRFEECAKAHRWLKGVDKNAEKELEDLIRSQKEYLQNTTKQDTVKDHFINNFLKTMTCQEFYKPVLLCILIMSQFHALGKIVCSMYSIELIKKITESESTAYMGMLILDGVSVFGMYSGCILSKFVKRRILLFSASALSIFFLFSLSLYLWLVNLSVVTENKIVSVGLLVSFSISVSCGPMIMSTSIYGELIPLRYKSSAVIITVVVHFTLMSTSIKFAPFFFKTLNLYGTFCFYGVLSSIISVFLYKYLPETKDKTLQEIENYFRRVDSRESKEITNLMHETK